MQNAWLMLSTGERRTHHGHDGYDDIADSHYSWDSTVPNHSRPEANDLIVIWNGRGLVGYSKIERILFEQDAPKVRKRCPNCNATNIHLRVNRRPPFNCRQCHVEFVEPIIENITVDTYRSEHAEAWVEATEALTKAQLRECCLQTKSQHSIRQLEASRFFMALRSSGRNLPEIELELPQGHKRSEVNVRIGQREFRKHLFQLYGEVCAISGPHPSEVLEAAHLYSYAETGEHHSHGGILLRRDIHRLFDAGLVMVDPEVCRIVLSAALSEHPSYRHLNHGTPMVELGARQLEWLKLHYDKHSAGAG